MGSVRGGTLPPGCTRASLKKNYNLSARQFLLAIAGKVEDNKYTRDNTITLHNCKELTGLIWESSTTKNAHRHITTICSKCSHEEVLDYGTLSRMVKAGNKYCRVCGNRGGKQKPLSSYPDFDGFTKVSIADSAIKYLCKTCNTHITRGLQHAKTSEYIVCEICYPYMNTGCKYETEEGSFDSKIEHLAYIKLVEILGVDNIVRQISYNELFNTGTKHTADFYIPKIDLVLEVTTKTFNLDNARYRRTSEWKMAISPKVKFAYSITEVEDIVRALLKDREVPARYG